MEETTINLVHDSPSPPAGSKPSGDSPEALGGGSPHAWYSPGREGSIRGYGEAFNNNVDVCRWRQTLPESEKLPFGRKIKLGGGVVLPENSRAPGQTVAEFCGVQRVKPVPGWAKEGGERATKVYFNGQRILALDVECQRQHPELGPTTDRYFHQLEKLYGPQIAELGKGCGTGWTAKRGSILKLRKREASGDPYDLRVFESGCKAGEPGELCTPEAWELYKSLRMNRNGLKHMHCYRFVAGEGQQHGWRVPGEGWFRKEWKRQIPRGAEVLHRCGPRAFEAKCTPKMDRDFEEIGAGEWWCLDGRTLDSMGRVPDARCDWRPRRPVVTGVLDMRSRALKLDVRMTECSDGILAGIKQALVAWGAPRHVIADNGTAYKAAVGSPRGSAWHRRFLQDPRIGSCFAQLNVEVHNSTPYHPWAKQVESGWNKVKEGFDRWLWLSFWGGKPDERPEGRAQEVKRRVDELPTEDELRELLAIWLEEYHATPQGGRGTCGYSASIVMEQYRDQVRPVSAELANMLCRRLIEKPVKVGQAGVCWNGHYYGQWDEKVWTLQGREVLRRVESDRCDRIELCELNGKPLCYAHQNQLFGASQEHRREAHRKQQRYRRMMKEYGPAFDYLAQTPTQQVMEIKRTHAKAREAEQRKVLPPAPTPDVVLVRPDLEQAAQELERGEQRRQQKQAVRAAVEGSSTRRQTAMEKLANRALQDAAAEQTEPGKPTRGQRLARLNYEERAG